MDFHLDQIEDASSILLAGPLSGEESEETCVGLLDRDDPPGTNVLSVTVGQTPGERLAIWQRQADEGLPARAAVVDVTGRGTAGADSDLDSSITLDVLPPSAGPVDVGMAVANRLGYWDGSPESTVLCLHSLTALIDTFETEQVVELVNGLNDLCEARDVHAHHHIDPGLHDEELVAMLRSLYDAVIAYDPDRGWRVEEPTPATDAPTYPEPPRARNSHDEVDPQSPDSFGRILGLLSSSRRRALLYHLLDQEDGTTSVDDLVEGTLENGIDISTNDRRDVRVSLVHSALPPLDNRGIVSVDGDVVRYHPDPTFESVVRRIRDVERGHTGR